MSKVFNTQFENSLRVLLLLSADAQTPKNADMVTALDFVAVYGGSLGLSSTNLHGENPYRFSEYKARRVLIVAALKDLVMRGLVTVENLPSGYCYKINTSGLSVVKNLDSDYGDDYLVAARAALSFAKGKTEQQLVAFIAEHEALTLKTGECDG